MKDKSCKWLQLVSAMLAVVIAVGVFAPQAVAQEPAPEVSGPVLVAEDESGSGAEPAGEAETGQEAPEVPEEEAAPEESPGGPPGEEPLPEAGAEALRPEETPEAPPLESQTEEDKNQEEEQPLVDPLASEVSDGVFDDWQIDPLTEKGGETCELTTGHRLHIASTPKNVNNPSASGNPAVFVNNSFAMPESGFLQMTLNSVASEASTRFGIYLNYATPGNALMVGYDPAGWFWQTYSNNSGAYYSGARVPAPRQNVETVVRLEWSGKSLTKATANGVNLFPALPLDFSAIGGEGSRVALKAGSYNTQYTDMLVHEITYTGQQPTTLYSITGMVQDTQGAAIKNAAVQGGGRKTYTGADGAFSLDMLRPGEYSLLFTHDDYADVRLEAPVTITDGDAALAAPVQMEAKPSSTQAIASAEMKALLAKDFPRVESYRLGEEEAVFYGQPAALDTITLNGVDIRPEVTAVFEADHAVYTLKAQSLPNNIHATLTARMAVEKNTLSFTITGVENHLDNNEHPVETIEIKNHSLVSVRDDQEGAQFAGAVMASHSGKSGDLIRPLADMPPGTGRYMYGFVSGGALSAGLWSNSEYGGVGGGWDNNRVAAVTEDRGYKATGLGSSFWYYNRKIKAEPYGPKQAEKAGLFKVMEPTELPSAKVVITGDANGDGNVDWQDGAIAFRGIMNHPFGYEDVPELVGWRIAMNFGSHAQNPFLVTLDNVKRVAMHTDGLGQSVLLKGYGNEGHDSAHPDYADVGRRIGGEADMKTMMREGNKLGARFGIHVNAGEMYPEAKAFDELRVRYKSDGSLRYGWNWIDQGIGIDSRYDHLTGDRRRRFAELQQLLGGESNDMNFVYLDIWGNNTGSAEDAWDTRQVMKEINDLGWRFGNEWSWAGEYGTTFSHWSMDLGYGGVAQKGNNSAIMRFIRNHQRDTWPAERSAYKGAAVAPLLGGYNMKDFEGWQGRNDYDEYILNLYSFNLVTKFLQHYKVVQWENGAETHMGTSTDGSTVIWAPEMKIVLRDDAGNEIVVTRGSNDYRDLSAYRSRTITLNGVTILEGEMAEDSNLTGRVVPKTEKYLLPWAWDANTGARVPAAEEKLYHFNARGGQSTWQLPEGWAGLPAVCVYQLTDTGRAAKQEVPVTGGKITLDARANTPYLLVKGDAPAPQQKVEWSTGMHITDTGFNSGTLAHWTFGSEQQKQNAAIQRSAYSNPMLALSDKAELSQKLAGLKPNQKYAAYVGIDNRSDARAWIKIHDGDTELAANYTRHSIAKNYVQADAHNTNSATIKGGGSYFQNMFVFFETPENTENLTLTLARDAGGGTSYFDGIRLVETGAENILETGPDGRVTKFRQDFEHNPAGLYPFVVGASEGVQDNRIHLSEKHAPYTQAGWGGVKKMDDVLGGDWSLKVNGLSTTLNALMYQTIPQNFRFEPGVTYHVEFQYQMGSPGIYQFMVGDGEFDRKNTSAYELEASPGATQTARFSVVGAASGDTWIGIYSSSTRPVWPGGITNDEATFGGYKDIVLDNLVISKSEVSKKELSRVCRAAAALYKQDYQSGWEAMQQEKQQAEALLAKADATQAEVDACTARLQEAVDALAPIVAGLKGVVAGADGKPLPGVNVTLLHADFPPQVATTNEQGEYQFKGIFIRKYSLRIVVPGYVPVYGDAITILQAGAVAEKDYALKYKVPPDYLNDFESGDIGSIQNIGGTQNQCSVELVEHNGGKAALLVFPGGSSIAVDKNAPTFRNGSIEADVTPLDTVNRFGMVLRAKDESTFLLASSQDAAGKYFWEYFGGKDGSKYSSIFTGEELVPGETAHLKMEVVDSRVSFWVNGQRVFNATLSGPPDEAAFAGFHSKNSGRVIVDNLEINVNDPRPDGAFISGCVSRKNETEPLAGVQVTLSDTSLAVVAQTTTDAKGGYKFDNLADGKYILSAGSDGCRDFNAVVDVIGKSQIVDIDLVYTADLVQLVETGKNQEKKEYFSAKSWNYFVALLGSCEKLLENDNAAQTAVDEMETVLREAWNSLVKEAAAALQKLVQEHEATQPDGYTDSSWKAFADALRAAQAVLDNAAAGMADIEQAMAAVAGAAENLERAILVESVAVTPASLELAAGESARLQAAVLPQNAHNPRLAWESSAPAVASVDADGRVTAAAPGKAVVTATARDGSGKKGSCTVTVTSPASSVAPAPSSVTPPVPPVDPPPESSSSSAVTPPVPAGPKVTGLKFPQASVTLQVKASITMPAVVYTSGGKPVKASYKSSRPKVATVTAGGKITAKAAGKTTITATAGSKKVTLKVTVVKRNAKVVVPAKVTAKVPKTMKLGQSKTITAKYTPAKAAGVKVTYKSSRSSVVSVDKSGTLKAKKKGKAVITVKAGKVSRQYVVTVR